MNEPTIRIEALRVVRGGQVVLPELTLDIHPGEITGLLGPSGCGKSTLMRAVVGVQRIESGTVSVLGVPAGSASLRNRVGYVTQAPSVYDDLSIQANLRYYALIFGVSNERIAAVLDTVGLTGVAEKTVRNLSGGQRARVSLATALLNKPEVLILDEPTVGLDPVLRMELWDTFHELAEAGATLLVSSHVMDEAERCDRLLLMREGDILADGTPHEIMEQAGTDDVEGAFLHLVRSKEESS